MEGFVEGVRGLVLFFYLGLAFKLGRGLAFALALVGVLALGVLF
jgi:hypothetical protein